MALSSAGTTASAVPDAAATAANAAEKRAGFCKAWAAAFFQVFLLLGGLAVYTGTPLLINFSVTVTEPRASRFVDVTLPAQEPCPWTGLDLAHRDGVLFVERLQAGEATVLPGDAVGRVEQLGGEILFDRDRVEDRANVQLVQQIQGFLENITAETLLPIDRARDVKVRFDFYHVERKTGDPYLVEVVILGSKMLGACICILIAATRDLKELRLIFKVSIWCYFLPALTVEFLTRFCELTANQRLPAALYSVLSRFVLTGTAIFRYIAMGQKQTMLQASLLTSVTLIILAYSQVPDVVPIGKEWRGLGSPYDPTSTDDSDLDLVGLAAVAGYVIGSVLHVVIVEKVMKKHLADASMIGVQGIMSCAGVCIVLPIALFKIYGTGWKHGPFGGDDAEFWHCSQDWTRDQCLAQAPVTLVMQGWDWRTVALVLMYVGREFVLNALTREFSSLIRVLVASASVAATYAFSVYFLDKPFNASKCILIGALLCSILQYSLAPKAPEPATKPSTKSSSADLAVEMVAPGGQALIPKA